MKHYIQGNTERYNIIVDFFFWILCDRKIKEKKLLGEVNNSLVKMNMGNEDTCKVVLLFELCI